MKRFSFLCPMSALLILGAVLVGCPRPVDVIRLSNTTYDFGLNTTPWTFQVWNSDATLLPELDFVVRTDASWLTCTPDTGMSTGSDDKKVISVYVDRTSLSRGRHKATIFVSSRRAYTKSIEISVTSEGTGTGAGGWTLKNVATNYAAPYLLEFDFSLRDENSHAVVAEPSQFQVTCREDAVPISSETGWHLAKGANKQLLTFLVLDYTLSMTSIFLNGDTNANGISDAIDNMQDAAKNVFLDSLSVDAQVGIYEFHRGDRDPMKMADFSTDKAYLKARIDAIWPLVRTFPAESRCWDALFAATQEFDKDAQSRRDEQRAIIFLSDGRDESSVHTYQAVIDEAKKRGIALYCIGFGGELDISALQVITSQTGGEYYAATTVGELGARFLQITHDLGGQYSLRWATLKRADDSFMPAFTVKILEHALNYAPSKPYNPTDYQGDPLRGILRVVPSEGGTTTAAFLRAAYVPRYITRIALHTDSPYAFNASLVEVADGGLCDDAAWDLTVEDVPEGGRQVLIETHHPDDISTALPYAAFGPILKFEFTALVEDFSKLFTSIEVDNTLYQEGGQSFELTWPPL
jgi:hypothetical protein